MRYADRPWVRSYDAWVDAEPDIPDVSYTEILKRTFRDYADRPAFYFMGAAYRFRDFDEYSRRFGHFLRENGYGPGDVVAISLPNLPQYLIGLAGAMRAGCPVTGVSPLLSPDEIAYQLNDSGARVLLTLDALFEHKFCKVHEQTPGVRHVVTTSIADFLSPVKAFLAKRLKKIPTGTVRPLEGKHVLEFKHVMRSYSPEDPGVESAPDDTCLIQYTGGTTGGPKGAELAHRSVVMNALHTLLWFNHTPGTETYCSAFPLFHIAGLGISLIAIAGGTGQVLIPDPRNTKLICKAFAQRRPAILFNVPSLYHLLMHDPAFKTLDFSCCKAFVSGAAPFAPEAMQAFEALVGKNKVVELYGMTETCGVMTCNPYHGTKKIGSVGLPMPNMRIKIVDVETGARELPVGGEGEIIARGGQVNKRYFNKPEETAHALRLFNGDNWLYTGDVGKFDEDGYLYIVDRVKDMINVGGYKVFSKEVEDKMQAHPAVDVCAFIGVPNPERPGSEVVKAVIQLTPEYRGRDPKDLERDLLAYAREHMAPYKVPKLFQFIDQVPLTPVGKVDKKALRK